jgi:hypothetical protein
MATLNTTLGVPPESDTSLPRTNMTGACIMVYPVVPLAVMVVSTLLESKLNQLVASSDPSNRMTTLVLMDDTVTWNVALSDLELLA